MTIDMPGDRPAAILILVNIDPGDAATLRSHVCFPSPSLRQNFPSPLSFPGRWKSTTKNKSTTTNMFMTMSSIGHLDMREKRGGGSQRLPFRYRFQGKEKRSEKSGAQNNEQ